MYSARGGRSKAAAALIFARLEGCAQSAAGGLSLAGANADLFCAAIVFAVVIYAVFYVAHNSLERLTARLALCFVLLFFHLNISFPQTLACKAIICVFQYFMQISEKRSCQFLLSPICTFLRLKALTSLWRCSAIDGLIICVGSPLTGNTSLPTVIP